MAADYLPPALAPRRQDIDQLPGMVVLEFGTGWCGFCRRAEPGMAALLAGHPEVRHLKVEDGPGRKLGRSFGVKLWPTFVLLRDGAIVRQLVRPSDADLEAAFRAFVRTS